jgi:hypothetical protein
VKKPKGYAARMRELKSQLHYHRMYYRMELAGAERSKAAVKEIARKMRELQKGEK